MWSLMSQTSLGISQSDQSSMFSHKIVYRKVPKFLDPRKLCCNLPKIQTKSPNLRVFHQKDTIGIADSEDPDEEQSDLGLRILP